MLKFFSSLVAFVLATSVAWGATSTSLDVSWTAPSPQAQIYLERCAGDQCVDFLPLTNYPATQISYSESGLTPGAIYGYRIKAQNADGTFSDYGNPVYLAAAADGTETVSTLASVVDLYSVELGDANCANFIVAGTPPGTTLTAQGLTPSTTYCGRVRAYASNTNLFSQYSITAFGTTLAAAETLNVQNPVMQFIADPPLAPVMAYALNEGSGTVAVDSVGGHAGTILGSPVWAQGEYGQAINFDAVNDAVVFPHLGLFSGAQSFSISAWVKGGTGAYGGSSRQIIHTRGETDFGLEYDPTGGLQAVWYNGAVHASAMPAPVENQWYHLAAVWNVPAGTLTLYVNGAPQPSVAIGTPSATSGDNTIGGRIINSGGSVDKLWLGFVDNVRIYNKALTPSEVTLDMNTPI